MGIAVVRLRFINISLFNSCRNEDFHSGDPDFQLNVDEVTEVDGSFEVNHFDAVFFF